MNVKALFIFLMLLFCRISSAFAQYSYVEQFPEHRRMAFYSAEEESSYFSETWMKPMREKPGYAFLGSALIPGLSQAANEKWIRAGVYVVAEITTWLVQQSYLRSGRKGEKDYHSFINKNWSVLKYAEFLVDYHNTFNPSNPVTLQDLLNSGVTVSPGEYGYGPNDWKYVNIEALRALENQTKFDFNNVNSNYFSHNIPDYGSQQYYELSAKYYQFGPGWRDFGFPASQVSWTKDGMSPMFFVAADKSTGFNDDLRVASRLISVVLLNHIVSAFDGYVTVRLKNYELGLNAPNRVVTGVGVEIPF